MICWKEGKDMIENMTQDQRLDYLVEKFKEDSVQYKDLKMPVDTEGKRRILRSLMNILMPRMMPDNVLAIPMAGRHYTFGCGCHC